MTENIPPSHLLLVDDQEPNLLLLSELVEVLGYTATTARNGREALARLAEQPPDMVLLDIMMPEMDGEDVLARIKAHPDWQRIPVVMISALDDMERVARCIASGAADYLVKPFHHGLLKARIHACLRTKHLEDQDRENRARLVEAGRKISDQNTRLQGKNRLLQREIAKRFSVERDLRRAQGLALRNAHAAGMAELARSVLHHVGNTLNSVYTGCHQLQDILSHTCVHKLELANRHMAGMLEGCRTAEGDKRATLLHYYQNIGEMWRNENVRLGEEIAALVEKVELVKNTVQAQSDMSSDQAFVESLDPVKVVDDVLRLQAESLTANHIHVTRRLQHGLRITGQRAKLSHVVLSLLVNAREAIEHGGAGKGCITVETGPHGHDEVYLRISDTGEGIPTEHLQTIFSHGFTTRENAGGFGLHAAAIAVHEMKGRIEVASDGPGTGAGFTLTFKKALAQDTPMETDLEWASN